MKLTAEIEAMITTAEAKALATTGPAGLNVVPVSVVNVKEGNIYLYDFFMKKTAVNVKAEATVVLTAWSGLAGVQVHADAIYIDQGEVFSREADAMKVQFPERTLKGVIVLTPTSVYDISAGAKAGTPIEP
jgi:predicted pyridoxine 5'-phosphate oxidase superfamily flavin-nucleotide-binding protein